MAEKRQYVGRYTLARPDMLATGPTPRENAIIATHAARLQRLTEAGTVALVGRTMTTTPDWWAIAIFCAESDEAARALIAEDPCIAQGVMQAELFPFQVLTLKPESADPRRVFARA